MHLEETLDGAQLVEQLNHHIESLQMPPEETHVCLIGEKGNDPNLISFVSQLLKQKRKYISIIHGGFEVNILIEQLFSISKKYIVHFLQCMINHKISILF